MNKIGRHSSCISDDCFVCKTLFKEHKEEKQMILVNLILSSGRSDSRKLELIEFVFDK